MCLKTSSFQSGPIDYQNPEEMSFKTIREFLITHSKDLFFVRIHGGEPLVYTKIVELLELLNELKLPYDIATNGSLLDEKIRTKIVGQYCLNLSISLDAGTTEVYKNIRKGGELQQISSNLIKINEMKTKKKTELPIMNATMCVFKFNIEEISNFIHFCHNHSILSTSISEGKYYGNKAIMESDLVIYHKEKTHIEIKKALEEAKKSKIKIRLRFPSLLDENYKDIPFHKGKILPKNCLNLYASVWLKPNFDLIGCSSSKFILGNLVKNDFDEIWNNGNLGYAKLRKTFSQGAVPDNCKNCIYSGGFLS